MLDPGRRYCSSVDHAYASVTLMWCPHERAFTLISSCWLEPGTEPQELDGGRYVRLGPFDDRPESLKMACAELIRLVALLPD